MRYQVRLIDGNHNQPIIVEATEFHTIGGNTVSFLSYRMRDNGLTDQWGNISRQRQRTTVAFFSNVESVMEVPDEGEVAAEGVAPEAAVPFGGAFPGATPWDTAGHGMVRRNFPHTIAGEIPTPRLDDDGVNWDDERVER